MIPRIKEFREANGMVNEPAILLIDNFPAHTSFDVVAGLSRHRVKAIPFPPQSSGIRQRLDLVFLGVFEGIKEHLSRDSSLPAMEDHAKRTFKGRQAAGAISNVRALIHRAGSRCVMPPTETILWDLMKGRAAARLNSAKSGILTTRSRSPVRRGPPTGHF
jgi:hypothetical protein